MKHQQHIHLGRPAVLGKRHAVHDPRTLLLATYFDMALPPPPTGVNWSSYVKQPWGMMLNDNIGDCAIAGAAHQIQSWTSNDAPHVEVTVPNDAILRAYEDVSGYNPSNPYSDNGCILLDVLKYWQKKGIGGNRCFAYAGIEPGNTEHVKQTIYLFGGAYIGLMLPLSAQNQRVWSLPPGGLTGRGEPGSWGGHCVYVCDYDANYVTCVTWGMKQRMTWKFFHAYCDESYAVLSQQWTGSDNRSPSGFDIAGLTQDLRLLSP